MSSNFASKEATSEDVLNPFDDPIQIEGDSIRLDGFVVQKPDLVRHLESFPAEERAAEMIKIIDVGLFCILRSSAAQNAEYIKQEAQRVIDSMESRFGTLPQKVRDELLERIGTGDGQVLKPVSDLIELVHKALKETLGDVSKLVTDKLDPEKETTYFGRALNSLAAKLDPNQKGSVQSVTEEAIKNVTGVDGTLAKVVKETVTEAIKSLKEEVDKLAKEVRGQDAAEEALQQTTEKGRPYEEEVVGDLQSWAQAVGAGVDDLGPDNKPGDVMVTIPQDSVCGVDLKVIVEARDRTSAKGRKAISEDMDKKMAERECNAAIYLSRTQAGLAKEVGDFSEGTGERGPWVATTHDHLITAVRLVCVLHRLRTARSESREFDSALIEAQLKRIRTSLKRITTINGKVSKARSCVDDINTEAVAIRDEIREALAGIEDAFRQAA